MITIQATGATVLFVHHTGKTPNGSRGGTALPAGLDTVLALTGDEGLVTLQVEKQRHAEEDAVWHFVLAPEGTTDMAIGHALPSLRDPREPNYEDPNTGPDLWDPNKTASLADSYSVEALEGDRMRFEDARHVVQLAAQIRFLA